MASKKIKVVVVVGARPNFVKAAVLLSELQKRSDKFEISLVKTGQHYDYEMTKIFFDEFGIKDFDMDLKAAGGSHIETTVNVLKRFSKYLDDNKFDYVLVFGDVNSTLASAIAASKNKHKLIHVESGLRSFDRRMPEEINRAITDHISDVLFVTEQSGIDNLKNEGVHDSKVHFVGNVMIDTLEKFLPKILKADKYKELGLTEKKYILATIHRQENVDDEFSLKRILDLLSLASTVHQVVLVLHPRTRNMIESFGMGDVLDNFVITPPLGYVEFLNLQNFAHAVITDSGGVQEETSYLGVPCITFRDTTERPVTVDHGTNVLVKIHDVTAMKLLVDALNNPKKPKNKIPLWDGQTSVRIADILETL